MTASGSIDPDGIYFFLSYAHPTPTAGNGRAETDHWVGVFYRDLHRAVRMLRPDATLDIGFYDDLATAGSDWTAAFARALAVSEVFIPLYSPSYLNKARPIRERESFGRRLAASGSDRAGEHLIPVLWIPVPTWDRVPEVGEALELAPDIPDYAENGLRALCMLKPHREQYMTILNRIAGRIVKVAEQSPLGPSRDPVLAERSTPPQTDTPFVVATIAPTVTHRPPLRLGGRYGASSIGWRPFGAAQANPIANAAAAVAERLGLPTRVVDYVTGSGLFSTCPGLVLIDPWCAVDTDGASLLPGTLASLREWVLSLVVVDESDPQYAERGAALGDEVTDMLTRSGVHRVRRARGVAEFARLMPTLVTEARRQYLKNAPVYPPKGSFSERPRITHSDKSTQHIPREEDR